MAQWRARGVEARLLDADEIRDLIGSDHYEHGLFDPRGGNVQPLSYARGLAHAAIAEGVVIHGASKAVRIERSGNDWRVSVEGGASVTARHVLIGTNGYTDDLWPGASAAASFRCAPSSPPPRPSGTTCCRRSCPAGTRCRRAGGSSSTTVSDRDGRFVIGGHGNLFQRGYER